MGQIEPAFALLHAGAGLAGRALRVQLETPWADLPTEVKIVVLYGTGKTPVPLTFIDGKKAYTVTKPFEGVIGNLNRRMLQTERVDEGGTGQVQTSQPCEVCEGKRLKPEALCVKVAQSDISSATRFRWPMRWRGFRRWMKS
jgi:excinuclease ABC subunit A